MKEELVRVIAEQTGASKQRAGAAFDAVMARIRAEIVGSGYANLPNLCSFSVVKRAARVARNPRTGQVVKVEASLAVRIKPMKALRDALSQAVDVTNK